MPEIQGKIITIQELFKLELAIADYQRPYKWSERSVNLLIDDLKEVALDSRGIHYRLGTIIVHRDREDTENHCTAQTSHRLNIVDGQQRVITLALLLVALYELEEQSPIFDPRTDVKSNDKYAFLPSCFNRGEFLRNKITQQTIARNYALIKNRVRLNSEAENTWRTQLLKAFEKRIEVILIEVSELAQAFQVFDSQNGRGKKLDPHDLLKAYHLRCMREYHPSICRNAVLKWENHRPKEISELFEKYLHRILCWRLGKTAIPFTEHEIEEFKGIGADSGYRYAQRAISSSSLVSISPNPEYNSILTEGTFNKVFQIGEPFISGLDFFEMVSYYLDFLKKIKKFVKNNIQIIAEQIDRNNKNSGFQSAFKLLNKADSSMGNIGYMYSYDFLLCITLYFFDRFDSHLISDNIEKKPSAIKSNYPESFIKLFTWAMLPRIHFSRLGFSSINKYALGRSPECGCDVNLFNVIAFSRTQSSLINLPIPTIGYIDNIKVSDENLKDIVWIINALDR